jgi:F-type H+-transporting ATPase subunit gamma
MQQAMRAMNLVATAKLQRVRQEWQHIRGFVEGTDRLMLNAAADERAAGHYFVQGSGSSKRAVYLVISSDRGKCGGYNINVAKAALTHATDYGKEPIFHVMGLKGLEYFLARKITAHYIQPLGQTPRFIQAQELGKALIDSYRNPEQAREEGTLGPGEADEVYIVYTRFTSILATDPKVVQVLPLGSRLVGGAAADDGRTGGRRNPMVYDPSPEAFLTYMASNYLSAFIYGAMMESVVCEQAARMLNMDAATNNAQEIIEDLTLMYNRQRQGAITQEITEIVSGANALQ